MDIDIDIDVDIIQIYRYVDISGSKGLKEVWAKSEINKSI